LLIKLFNQPGKKKVKWIHPEIVGLKNYCPQ